MRKKKQVNGIKFKVEMKKEFISFFINNN